MPLPPNGDFFRDSSRLLKSHLQQGAYMPEIQQFKTLHEKYRALELQVVKVTAECNTILYHMDEYGNPLSGGDTGDDDSDNTLKGKKRKQCIESKASEVLEKKIIREYCAATDSTTTFYFILTFALGSAILSN
ncbi:hypothetical protein C8R48DRAFT_673344 [Suillus tomentosus]|nr:hypothetical protein C8R48DRAFT_673344 [Suillus tomentosus]